MMNIHIYQINPERDENRLMFMDTDYLVHKVGGVTPDSATYDLIYEGKVDCKSLEDVYRVFNLEHPVEFMGHSLSVSDVVEVVDGGREKPGFYFCDTFGFKNVPFDPNAVKTLADRGAISVVIVEPGKLARQAYIDSSLSGMQRVVGGDIEAVYPFKEEVCLVCNEEGKIKGLPLNRALYDRKGNACDAIAGTFFICGCGGERFSGLTDDQLKRYTQLYKYPERFVQARGKIIAIKDPIREGGDKER